jgi:hypothetical protein
LFDQLTTLGKTAAQIKKTCKDGAYPCPLYRHHA